LIALVPSLPKQSQLFLFNAFKGTQSINHAKEKIMYRRLILFSAALLMSLGLFSQSRIGFTNLNGFPSTISSSGSYNLSGFILNTGTDTLFNGMNIKMSVNNGPTLSIQNNVPLSTPLAPGDSVYWSKGGHNFPGGQFAPGNNDVLIWPTRMSGPASSVLVDTLLKNMFFTRGAAFALTGTLGGVDQAIPLRTPVTLNVYAQNVGGKQNKEQVRVYMAFNGGTPVILADDYTNYAADENFSIDVPNFSLHGYLEMMGVSIFEAMFGQLTFWVAEKDGMPPVTTIAYPVAAFNTSYFGKMGARSGVYPNPANQNLNIAYDGENSENVSHVRLFNINGQLLREFQNAVGSISLEGLASGRYFLEIHSGNDEVTVHPFIKE
jgi:hypothetical protein